MSLVGARRRGDGRDAGVGAARAVGVLDLPVAVGRRQRVEHAAARFLDLVLEVGDGAEAVHQPLVHQLACRGARAADPGIESRDGGRHEADGGHERGRRAEPVEQAAMERLGGIGHDDHRPGARSFPNRQRRPDLQTGVPPATVRRVREDRCCVAQDDGLLGCSRMKRLLKWLAILVAGIGLAIAALVAYVYVASGRVMARTYTVEAPQRADSQ